MNVGGNESIMEKPAIMGEWAPLVNGDCSCFDQMLSNSDNITAADIDIEEIDNDKA